MNSADQLVQLSQQLRDEVNQLSWQTPSHVYNPLNYAWGNHLAYIQRFGVTTGRVLMVGMNPGPWGMAQTGIPFGDVELVSQWLQLTSPLVMIYPLSTLIIPF